jgi:hypothetical protein
MIADSHSHTVTGVVKVVACPSGQWAGSVVGLWEALHTEDPTGLSWRWLLGQLLRAVGVRCQKTAATAARVHAGGLEARWTAIRSRIERHAAHLTTQGTVVAKRDGDRRYWVLRFRVREGGRIMLRSVYLCGDDQPELLERARCLLLDPRGPSRWPREVAACARCARAVCAVVRRLTGRPGVAGHGRGEGAV